MELFGFEEVLEEMALENRIHFSPHYVNQRGQFNDLNGVTVLLLQAVGRQLTINFEVECPNGHSDFAIDSLESLPKVEVVCHICCEEYEPSEEDIWVSFDFTPSYIQHVKKKSKISTLKTG